MRIPIGAILILLSTMAHASEISDRASKIDSQLDNKGVAIVCLQSSNGLALELDTDKLNSIISGLKNNVSVSVPAITSGGSYSYQSICVTVTKK